MEWKKITPLGDGSVKIPDRWLHLYYYEALNILFRFENSLRVFVYAVLKNELQSKWSQLSITSDDAEQGTIESIAKKRKVQAGRFGYLGYSIQCPVMHLTSGELIGIITHDSYWKYFAKFFPGSKEIMKNKLEEIGVIRNALAHFRPLKEDDVEVIKQNVKQVLMVAERYLISMFHCDTVIPTNLTEVWYKELSTLGNEFCKIHHHQSKDEQWIRISLTYNVPVIRKKVYGSSYVTYSVLNLISPAILKTQSELASIITCLHESIPSRWARDIDTEPSIQKHISLVIHRGVIEKQFGTVRKAIEETLHQIALETELVKNDHLAKGGLIENASISGSTFNEESTRIIIDISQLKCDVREGDPVEYWGYLDFITSDFVSASRKYPWMPVDISFVEDDIPF